MATDYIKALNAGTGLNTTEIIDGLMAAQREPAADKITKAREEKTVSISGLGVLKQTLNIAQTGLTGLEGITGLTLGNSGTAMEMTIADTSVAKAFSHKVEVSQLATSHTLVFSGFTSETQALGTGSLAFEFGGWSNNNFSANSDRSSKTITLANGADSLSELRDAINASDMQVTASIIKTSEGNFSLMLKSREGASHAMKITASADSGSSALAGIDLTTNASGNSIEQVAASDVSMTLDGVTISRDSNTVDDLINGVSLKLKAVTTASGGDTLSATYSETTAMAAMQALVAQINTMTSELTRLTSRGVAEGTTKGEMAGDPFLTAQLRNLKKMTTKAITGFGSETLYMTNFGVETQRDGTIKLNETKFKSAFAANPDGFAAMMDSRAVSSNGQVTTSLSGTDYVAGSYDLVISNSNGTIGGTTMSKSGTTYSATSGNAQGLALDFSGTDTTSTILIGRSMAQTLIDFTTELLKNDGTIEKKITAFNTGIADDDLAMTALDEKMEKIRARYVTRFNDMETMSSRMKRTGESLTNMMDAWRASLDN